MSELRNTMLVGDVMQAIRSVPECSVQCIVTSPPYYGLRVYGVAPTIWDGDPACDHDWTPHLKKGIKGGATGPKQAAKGEANFQETPDTAYERCKRCGALRCAYGQEPSAAEYVAHSVQILRALRRRLRDDGVVWWNIGDSFAGSGNGARDKRAVGASLSTQRDGLEHGDARGCAGDEKPKDLCLVPEQLVIALRADGWFVRSIVIWDKPNGMPDSVRGWRWERHRVKVGNRGRAQESYRANTNGQQDHAPGGGFKNDAVWVDCPGCAKCDATQGFVLRKGSWRPTDTYEHILFLAKSSEYYADGEAVKVPWTDTNPNDIERAIYGHKEYGGKWATDAPEAQGSAMRGARVVGDPRTGANLRSVWRITTGSGADYHFAVFPPALPETCIKASTSARGQCPKCGAPYARVTNTIQPEDDSNAASINPSEKHAARVEQGIQGANSRLGLNCGGRPETQLQVETLDWWPTCKCKGAGAPVPQIVLDPFMGSGTTGLVATRLGRDWLGIDANAGYAAKALERIAGDSPLFNNVELRDAL